MSEIPYSIRDKNIRINTIKGLNWDDISDNHIIKKVDENNAGDTNIINTNSLTQNTLSLRVGSGLTEQSVGVLDGEADVLNAITALHINTLGNRNRGMTIYDTGTASRVGIGITEPEEDLEVAGNIQIDSANVARLRFQQTGLNPHALGEIDGEQDGTDGGDLQFYTKVNGGNVTEKLRINNVGAIGIGGATFGDAGAVLQSNGNAASVSWTTTPIFDNAKVSNRLSLGNVGRDQNVIFGFSGYNLAAGGTEHTIKRLNISMASNGWNWMEIQIHYAIMQQGFGLPYGSGTARKAVYWLGSGTGNGGFGSNFDKLYVGSGTSQNDIQFRINYINNSTFDIVFRNDHSSNSVHLSCEVHAIASYADIEFI